MAARVRPARPGAASGSGRAPVDDEDADGFESLLDGAPPGAAAYAPAVYDARAPGASSGSGGGAAPGDVDAQRDDASVVATVHFSGAARPMVLRSSGLTTFDGDWPTLAARLPMRGLGQQLAAHLRLGRGGRQPDAEKQARHAMKIAAEICVYTNHNLVLEKL